MDEEINNFLDGVANTAELTLAGLINLAAAWVVIALVGWMAFKVLKGARRM